jgi:hypothetical protein
VARTTIRIGGDLEVGRIGYGAMRLTCQNLWGDYPDRDGGIVLLRQAVEADSVLAVTRQRYRVSVWPEVTVSSLVITTFGAIAVTFMMVMYAFERRHRGFVLAFAGGCLLSSAYGFLSGAWPFGVVEVIWAGVAARRYLRLRTQSNC